MEQETIVGFLNNLSELIAAKDIEVTRHAEAISLMLKNVADKLNETKN